MAELQDWERKYFTESGYDPFLYFVVYGNFEVDFKVAWETYNTAGIPEGIKFMKYDQEKHPKGLKQFLSGFLWEEVKNNSPLFAAEIDSSSQCYILKGEVKDSNTLNYYRDIIGIIAYLMEHGGICVYDPQMFTFWNSADWFEKIFKPMSAVPWNHVKILFSEEENGEMWFHTRGLRKYGRPDLSIHKVSKANESPVIDLLNRFIEFQAFGGIIEDGQQIKMQELPIGMRCENEGALDDPEFNNMHVEIYWE